MNKEFLSSFADDEALKKQGGTIIGTLQEVIDKITELHKIASETVSLGFNADGGKQGADNIKKTKQATNELALALQAYKKITDDVARSEARIAALDSDQAKKLAELKIQIQQTTKAQNDAIKAANSTTTAFQKLTAQYKAAESQYQEYYLTLGAGNAKTLEAQKRALELNNVLKNMQQGIGNFQRSVGNYATAFNGLSTSIQQILREAPSAAVSLNTFFLAISNNLPMFFDEVTKAIGVLNDLKTAQEASNLQLIKQTEIQTAAAAAQKAADEALSAQVDTIIQNITASKEQAAALREDIINQTAAAAATEENAAAIAVNTEALAINAGANAEDAAALAVQVEANVLATRSAAETTVALEAQTVATAEATAAAAAQPSVLAQIGKSLFSVNSLLTVGVLALTLYGGKLIDMLTGASTASKEAEKAIKKYDDSIRQAAISSREASDADRARMEILSQLAGDEQQTMKTRLAAIKELKDTYPDTFGNLKNQTFLEGKLKAAVEKTNTQLIARAAFQAAEKQFTLAGEKVYELQQQQTDAQEKLNRATKDFNEINSASKNSPTNQYAQNAAVRAAKAVESLQSDLEDVRAKVTAAQKEQVKYMDDARKFAAQAGQLVVKPIPDPKPKKEKVAKDPGAFRFDEDYLKGTIAFNEAIVDNDKYTLQQRIDALKAWKEAKLQLEGQTAEGTFKVEEEARKKQEVLIAKYYKDYQEMIIANGTVIQMQYTAQYAKEKAILDKQLNDGLISQKVYNDKIKALKFNTETEMLDAQIKSIQSEIFYLQQIGQDVSKLTDEYNKLNIAKNTINGKGETPAGSGFFDNNTTLGLSKEQAASIVKGIQFTGQLADQVGKVSQMFSDMYQSNIDSIEAEKQASQDRWNAEIDAINNATLTEEDRNKRLAEAKAQQAASDERLNNKINQQKRKQAQADKISRISSIISGTASAVVSALGAFPFSPANLILAGIVGTIGLAQLGIATAAPIPQYAEGTTDHPGGLAILGDGGQRELVKEPGKNPYWSEDSDTIYNLKPHTQVIPEDQVQKSMYAVGPGGMIFKNYNKDVIRAVGAIGEDITAAIYKKDAVVLTGRTSKYDKIYIETTRR